MNELILASNSPRRREILSRFEIPFSVITSPLEEVFNGDPPAVQAVRLSREKIEALIKARPGLSSRLILGADTCIDLDGKIIGKPANPDEARSILQAFSGRTHLVVTALTLYNGEKGIYTGRTDTAQVKFTDLSEDFIDWYLSTDEWKGAAGGYRIQEKGTLLIDSIIGDFYTIMGLPIRLFYGMLASQDSRYNTGKTNFPPF